MDASVAIFPIILLIAAAIAALTGFFALLTNPKTRPYLLGAMGFAFLVLLAVFSLYFLRSVHDAPATATVTYPNDVVIQQEYLSADRHVAEPAELPHASNSNVQFAVQRPGMLMLGPWVLIIAILILCGLMYALKVRGLAIGLAVILVALGMVGVSFAPSPVQPPPVARTMTVPFEGSLGSPEPWPVHVVPSDRPEPRHENNLPAEDPGESDPLTQDAVSTASSENEAVISGQQPQTKPATKAPSWIEQKPTSEIAVAKIGPFSSTDEIEAKLQWELADKVDRHAQRYFGVERPANSYVVPYDFIRSHVAQLSGNNGSPYLEARQHSVGKMYTMYVRLDFSRPEVRQQLVDYYQIHVVSRRIVFTGIVMALSLGMLGTVFSYLKLDTATKGYYTGRLQIAAAVITLLLIGGLVAALAQIL